MSLDSVNAKIEANPRLTFALTIYEYITSLIVVSYYVSSATQPSLIFSLLLSQGIYPTVVVILVHSSYSVLDSRAGTSARVFVSKPLTSRGASEGGVMHSNTSTAALSETGGVHKTEINLYEMSQMSHDDDTDKGGPLTMSVPRKTYNV